MSISEYEILSERSRAAGFLCGLIGGGFLFGSLFGCYTLITVGNSAIGGGDARIVAGLFVLGSLLGLRLFAEAGSYRLCLDWRTHRYEERSNLLGMKRCKVGVFTDFAKLELVSLGRSGVAASLYLHWRNSRRPRIWLTNYRSLQQANRDLAKLSTMTRIECERVD